MDPKANLFYNFDKLMKRKRDKRRIYPSKSTCKSDESSVFIKQLAKNMIYRFLYFIVSVSNPGIGNEVANTATS